MDIKLQKRLKNDELYFVVCNIEKKLFNDWFIFDKYKELPILEKYFFDLMSKELGETFNNKVYSSNTFKAVLLIMYSICFDGDKIDIKSSNLISNLYINLRYNDLANAIDFLKTKYDINSINAYKDELLNTPLSSLSIETRKKFDVFKNKVAKNKSDEEVFKELIYLCIYTEYERACVRAKKFNNLLDEMKGFAKAHNIKTD